MFNEVHFSDALSYIYDMKQKTDICKETQKQTMFVKIY